MGGGMLLTSTTRPFAPPMSFLPSFRRSCPLSVIPALFPSFLRRQERRRSCLRRNDEIARAALAPGSVPPTPHLASPLKGGRDELGKGERWERWECPR